MKNTKNTAKSEKGKTKSAAETASVPSDKIRGKGSDGGELPFKKVLYGYDPEEVASYINELSETAEASAKNYELKLSSIKEELVLSNRERDSYAEKYRKAGSKPLAVQKKPEETQKSEDKSAEYEAVISQLKKKLEQAAEENARLREEASQSAENAGSEYEKAVKKLKEENSRLVSENTALAAKAEKYDGLFDEYGAVLSQAESLKAETASKSAEIREIKDELEKKNEELRASSDSNETAKKKIAALEVENGVLGQRAEEREIEIARLKEMNKTQAYDYAEKITLLESEHANSRLAVQKEQKLHDYYIAQAEATLAELSKQMEQIRQSFVVTQEN